MKTLLLTCLALAFTQTAFAGDANPKYAERQGYMCIVPEDCFGHFCPGDPNKDAHRYISPLMCAMFDLFAMHNDPKFPDPNDPFEHPCIRGNTREKARDIAIALIRENKDNAVNDCYRGHGYCSTPLFLAARIGDKELVELILQKGGDPRTVVWAEREGRNILQQLEKYPEEIREILTNWK